MSSQAWAPECAEDELLVAFVAVKRGMQSQSMGADPGAFPVLHHLAARGPSRQGPLAEALGLDASTVSRHVRSLVADGLVDASRDPGDGRATVLSITEPGRQFLAERLRAHRATLQSATAGFTGQERADLVRLLHKLAAALGAAEETA
jgi:DNA-binding MarR family transcriptional regulator